MSTLPRRFETVPFRLHKMLRLPRRGAKPNKSLHLTGHATGGSSWRFVLPRVSRQVSLVFGRVQEAAVDAEVYWKGRHIARLTDYTVDYYKIFGGWVPVGDRVFEQHLGALRSRIAPDGQACLAIELRFPDGTPSQPARAYIGAGSDPIGYRFGEVGDDDRVTAEPTPVRDCVRCGCPIERDLLKTLPDWTRCRRCQIELEQRGG